MRIGVPSGAVNRLKVEPRSMAGRAVAGKIPRWPVDVSAFIQTHVDRVARTADVRQQVVRFLDADETPALPKLLGGLAVMSRQGDFPKIPAGGLGAREPLAR